MNLNFCAKNNYFWILLNVSFTSKIAILCKYNTSKNLKIAEFWKFKFTILLFFLKIQLLDTIWDFLTVWKKYQIFQIIVAASLFLKIQWRPGLFHVPDTQMDQTFTVSAQNLQNEVITNYCEWQHEWFSC